MAPALVPVVLAQVLVQAQLLPQPQLLVQAQRQRQSELQARVVLVLLAHRVVEPVVAVQLLSRQSFSAAMAASSPSLEEPTYGLVPKSRWPPKGRPCPSS